MEPNDRRFTPAIYSVVMTKPFFYNFGEKFWPDISLHFRPEFLGEIFHLNLKIMADNISAEISRNTRIDPQVNLGRVLRAVFLRSQGAN
jgi:hypothetical protein